MKQHITVEDISQLSEEQRQNLNRIWLPKKYDLASALICRDVSSEEFDKIEFVVGDMEVFRTTVMLYDLRYAIDSQNETTEIQIDAKDEQADEESNEEDDISDEDGNEGDFNYDYEQPTCFDKEDCVPLLNIGQMIEILHNNNFGHSDFFLSVNSGDRKCEIGNTMNFDNYGTEYESGELCDVLWESVKGLL